MTETTSGPVVPRLETRGNATVVMLSGKLDAEAAAALVQTIQEQVRERPRLVLDLSGVPETDSAGLGALVRALKAARDAGGELVLIQPRGEVQRLLDETGLDQVLPVFDDVEKACSHLTKI